MNENFKEAPNEIVVCDLIEDTSPLNTWDGDIYNEKYPYSIVMHVTRPYKRIKRFVATKKLKTFKYREMKRKKSDF